MLGNRVAKSARHLAKWARREGVTCYRLYDRDIPEIPLAVDWYDGRLHVAEYRRTGAPGPAGWVAAMAAAVAERLGVPADAVYTKARERQRGRSQYQRLGESDARFAVEEGGHRFWVNLRDYLDTGLFLDHRPTRARLAGEAAGKRFLNLFCYTGAFTVYAAAAGARESVNVDMSQRYLAWAEDNLALNDLDTAPHHLVRDDALRFLHDPDRVPERFDLALLDPPTFSNSKRMTDVLDIQRQHPELIAASLRLLRPGGVLYFSTNFRRFRFDTEAIRGAEVEDISLATIPPDFRDHKIHRCYRLVKR